MLTKKNYFRIYFFQLFYWQSLILLFFLFHAYPYSKFLYEIRIFIMAVCWLCSTVSLFFNENHLSIFERGIILVNFCCIYGWLFYFG